MERNVTEDMRVSSGCIRMKSACCIKAKPACNLLSKSSQSKAIYPLELIHSGTGRLLQILTTDGKRYLITIINDDYSRYTDTSHEAKT